MFWKVDEGEEQDEGGGGEDGLGKIGGVEGAKGGSGGGARRLVAYLKDRIGRSVARGREEEATGGGGVKIGEELARWAGAVER